MSAIMHHGHPLIFYLPLRANILGTMVKLVAYLAAPIEVSNAGNVYNEK